MTSKQLILFLSLFAVLAGAGICYQILHGPKIIDASSPYPRVVHTSCTNLWAIQTGMAYENTGPFIDPNRIPPKVPVFWGRSGWQLQKGFYITDEWKNENSGPGPEDTCTTAEAGGEYQFPDSAAAWNAYCNYYRVVGDRAEKKRIRDSIDQHHDDSIFNCQHGYNTVQ